MWLLAAVLGAVVAVAGWQGPDLPAQLFRIDLFRQSGLTIWQGMWYGGHHTPAYGILLPVLGAVLGPAGVGIASAAVSSWCFDRLVKAQFGPRAWLGSAWFAAGTATNLIVGRLTFSLGMAVGLGALLAVQQGRPRAALALGVMCPLASPVAAAFLALAAAVRFVAAWHAAARYSAARYWAARYWAARYWAARYWAAERPAPGWWAQRGNRHRLGLAMVVAPTVPMVALALAFPEGGAFPFRAGGLVATLGCCALALVALPRDQGTLRLGAVLYGGLAVVTFVLANPLGGNASRLAVFGAGPVLACALWRRRSRVVLVAALPLLAWQWGPAWAALRSDDPGRDPAYHAPLVEFLKAAPGPAGRVEVVPTAGHWEAAHVAPAVPLARGWERQLDLRYNRLFYEAGLTAGAYRQWLLDNGVRYVALADVALDPAGVEEAELLSQGQPWLRPAWADRHWTVWEVEGSDGLVSGPARLAAMGPDSFELVSSAAGTVLLRAHHTAHWVVEGPACVEPAPDGWTEVRFSGPGSVRLVTRLLRPSGSHGACPRS